MRSREHRRRRGFATTIALVLVGLVGLTLAAVAMSLTRDARRTGAEATDAQLRQLIVAGSIEARQFVQSGDAKAGDVRKVALPPELTNDGASAEVRWTQGTSGLEAEVIASIGTRHLTQRIEME
jgi:ABC-type transporter Mla subunit MlaD